MCGISLLRIILGRKDLEKRSPKSQKKKENFLIIQRISFNY